MIAYNQGVNDWLYWQSKEARAKSCFSSPKGTRFISDWGIRSTHQTTLKIKTEHLSRAHSSVNKETVNTIWWLFQKWFHSQNVVKEIVWLWEKDKFLEMRKQEEVKQLKKRMFGMP